MKSFSNSRNIPMSRSRGGGSAPNSSTAASQNMMSMLEARIASLENILGIDSSGDLSIDANKIRIRGSRIEIESTSKLTFKSGSELKLDGPTVDLRANSSFRLNTAQANISSSSFDLNATSSAKIQAGGMLELTGAVASLAGSVTKLGKGLLPVATASTSISAAGFTLSSTIASPDVLA